MKLTAVGLLKTNGPDKDPFLLGIEADLSTFGYFQRGVVRDMITFVSRTAAQRTLPGQRQTVQHEEYFCNVQNRDGLVGVVFVDSGYPSRAAFGILVKVLDEFSEASSDRWRNNTADSDEAAPILKSALTRYQVQPWSRCPTASDNARHCMPLCNQPEQELHIRVYRCLPFDAWPHTH